MKATGGAHSSNGGYGSSEGNTGGGYSSGGYGSSGGSSSGGYSGSGGQQQQWGAATAVGGSSMPYDSA